MKQKSFLFDPNLCLGCRACQMACAANRGLPLGIFWRRVDEVEYIHNGQLVKHYLSSACYQCENPECIRLCPQKAYRKRHDGIVILNSNKCNGCSVCIHACPFDAPVRDPISGHTTKCDYCYTRLDKGQNPYCIGACPVKALKIREFDENEDDEDETIVKELPRVPKIQLTHPSVRFRLIVTGKQVIRFQISREGSY